MDAVISAFLSEVGGIIPLEEHESGKPSLSQNPDDVSAGSGTYTTRTI